MRRRSIVAGYAVIGLIGLGLAFAVYDQGRRTERETLDHYLSSEHARTLAVADKAQSAIRSIYENLRTLSLLPSTRSIARHGENLSDEAKLTFQQVYNNLASSVSVSEVYILPADLDPDHEFVLHDDHRNGDLQRQPVSGPVCGPSSRISTEVGWMT